MQSPQPQHSGIVEYVDSVWGTGGSRKFDFGIFDFDIFEFGLSDIYLIEYSCVEFTGTLMGRSTMGARACKLREERRVELHLCL